VHSPQLERDLTIFSETKSYSYELEFTPTGERIWVSVPEEMQHLVADRSIFETYPESCPFLRCIPNGEARCIIHSTRPDYCKKSGCYDYLIKKNGLICGKIKNRFVIGAKEEVNLILANIHEIVSQAPYEVFIREVTCALIAAGYEVT
jgi:Fe-S-cluster containining protein